VSALANAERAASADAALKAYMSRTHCDCDDCLQRLLADLMCWADKCEFSFAEALHSARYRYNAALAEQDAPGAI
jgi:hypothetical protein